MQTDFLQVSFSCSVFSINAKEGKQPHLNLPSDLLLKSERAAASKGTPSLVCYFYKQDVTLITGATKISI